MRRNPLRAAALVAIVSGAYAFGMLPSAMAQSDDVVVPELSELAQAGQEVYDATCAACHGTALEGTENGPPFLHRVYAAGHHSDMAFILAIKNGTRAHHWRFGPMPAQEGITDEQAGAIITYIREIQAANGI